MRTIKTLLILLVTVGLVAAGASLPKLVAAVMDNDTINNAGYGAMPSVALDLSGERKPLSTAGKLVLLRRGENISIPEDKARMTPEEVNTALLDQLDQYTAAGIFEWFEPTSWVATPHLCIDQDDPDNYGIFWTVTVLNGNGPSQSLNVDIDDETGRIFCIGYEKYGEYALEGVWERNYGLMNAFVPLYLQQLGLPQEQQDAQVAPNVEYGELDGEVLWARFTFTDDEYGEIPIEFYVTGAGGFYNYFPE